MISEKMIPLMKNNSAIRMMFEEGNKLAAKYGRENVFDFSLGNPSVPAPAEVNQAIQDIVKEEDSLFVHGYMSNAGYEDVRETIAQSLNRRFGTSFHAGNILMTVGAASGLNVILKTLLNPGEQVITFAPYFVEYGSYVRNYDGELVVVSPNTVDFQPNLVEFEEKINEKTKAIIINTPNNPTGAVYNKEQLKEWVDYALNNHAVILFDSAYEAFISDPELPRSIYAIEGAKQCAIEFCSLSKTAGFTGTRCGYTVVPRELVFTASNGQEMSLHAMWNRRQSTKFNGTSYIIQKGAAAVFTEEGMAQCRENIAYYQENARIIADTLTRRNIRFFGGVHSPYIWFECPDGMESWEFFDYLLEKANIVGTPGSGFGAHGEGFFRLTAFGTHENTLEAIERIKNL